ncbi:hypothetical protein S-CBS2_gp100 [Synechococcus phage S-CBS2]|uniref:hypothetical protein n=1 Tax=Synechococcus phage S-CBS2 TaxID=753084 RepID=UPI0002078442|nr:hypothetical protein S-CBS2_gp100 [Synechococcus phage S-CBS2]ADF42456.1 hypothetical protein S-CBS2_gp100 [Synechococcus phage S-CBS2]
MYSSPSQGGDVLEGGTLVINRKSAAGVPLGATACLTAIGGDLVALELNEADALLGCAASAVDATDPLPGLDGSLNVLEVVKAQMLSGVDGHGFLPLGMHLL